MEKISAGSRPKNLQTKQTRYEVQFWQDNQLVIGIDEVGRGALAGPVVAAAVILFPYHLSPKIVDSKLLREKQLEDAASWIYKNSWHGIGIIPHQAVDKLNIYQATLLAMKRAFCNAVHQANRHPATLLVDAMPLRIETETPLTVHSLVKGESQSISIAAASIIAKVTRDSLMHDMAYVIPGYGFDQHKGYGTVEHQRCLREHGCSLVHRTTFLTEIEDEQISIW